MTDKVLYSSDEAAQLKTVTGWVSRLGHFYGTNEHLARYDGCTHRECEECGAEISKTYYICSGCGAKKRLAIYLKMPFAEWDGETPLCVFDDDKFFFSEDDLLDYCADLGIEPASLNLVICKPQYLRELEADEHFCDDLPEGESLKDLDRELWDAIEAVNAIIRKRKEPLSWMSGRYRTTYGKEE